MIYYKQRRNDTLAYFLSKGDDFEEFYNFKIGSATREEFFAKQICSHHVIDGQRYELHNNEMDELDDLLVVKHEGNADRFSEYQNYQGNGIHMEFRIHKNIGDKTLLTAINLPSHYHALEYLTKDIVDIPRFGQYEVIESEIDHGRGCYVLYVYDMKLNPTKTMNGRNLSTVVYFIKKGEMDYEEFYRFDTSKSAKDELLAKQLCTYMVLEGKQFKLIANEMFENEDHLVIQEEGYATKFEDETKYDGKEIIIEFRQFVNSNSCPLVHRFKVMTHSDVIDYLTKDVVDVPEYGQYIVDSSEVDSDRNCYVIYLEEK